MEPRERRACPLTDVGALARALAGPAAPVLLDIRWRLGGPPGIDSYRAGHLPRSVFVDLEADLAAAPGPAGRHPLPETGRFEAAMRRAGVSDEGSVVVYDETDATAAARAWWLLCYFGHRDCRLLDGGFRAWTAAGGQVATGDGPAPASGDFTARPGQMPVLDADAAAGPGMVGAYCGSGVTAAHEVLALELAGIPASLYVGSWSNWVADPARPVATGPEP